MPWHVTNRVAECDGWAVVADDDGDVVGCHATRAEAEEQMAALYANEPQMGTATSCSCQNVTATSTQTAWPFAAAATEPLERLFPVPEYPPVEWFVERPGWLEPGMKLTVDDSGRVAGYFYPAGQCLVHDHGACPRPSPTGYAAFHQQEIITDDGEAIRVGVIGNTNGHADPYAPISVAQAHYADPDAQLITCCAYDDEHGGYILGSMVPGVSYADVALVRRSALSGDWRPMPQQWWSAHGVTASVVREVEGYDCIGPTLVTRPGLPLIQAFVNAPSLALTGAILGGCGGIQLDAMEGTMNPTTTTIKLPDGVQVVSGPVPPGPHPARSAASPVPPQQAADTPMEEAVEVADWEAAYQELAAVVASHEERLAALEGMVGQMVGSQIAAIEADVVPLPA